MSARPHPSPTAIARAGIDPVADPVTALLAVGQFVTDPARAQILGLLIDHRWRAHTVVALTRVRHPDDVLDVAAHLASTARRRDRRVVLLSCRPGSGPDADDGGRWTVLDDLLHGGGLELLEWFVVGRTLTVPRERVGMRSRWPPRSAPARP